LPLIRTELRQRRLPRPGPLIHDINQVLYLSFDKDDANNARDRSGYNNHGTVRGAARVAGKVASALTFDGVDDFVACRNHPSLICPEALTILAWVNLASTGKIQSVADRYRGATNAGYRFSIIDDRTLEVRLGNGTTTLIAVSTKTIEWNAWHHIACVYDSKTGKVFVCVDGEKEDLTPFSGTLADADRVLQVSSHWFGTYLNGVVDEVRIYNRALSQAEIVMIMHKRGV